MNPLLGYIQTHNQRFVIELCELLRFSSVSGQPHHAEDVRRCAHWLAAHLRQLGLERVQIHRTRRHPLVTAEWRHAPGRPTLLIYGHYDVQPADPLHAWRTLPFAPVVQAGRIYGRGASDNKGPLFCHLKALEAYLHTAGQLPVNVICLFDGEEEIGSPSLQPFLERHHGTFAVDAAVISDTRFLARGRPAIIDALRGGLGLALTVYGPPRDIHSGAFGGAIHNPIQALSEILARLHDQQGRIAIPGFYDRVRRWGASERAQMAQQGPSHEQILRDAGTDQGWGEAGYSLYERTTIRPALTLNGIRGGYQGPGGKGIIPARASAKLSFRLVPDQEPAMIERLVRRHLAQITPPTVRTTLHTYQRAQPVLIDRHHPAMQAAVAAYRRGFGVPPVFLRSGGSIPVVNTLQTLLGIPTVLMGFALPDDGMHGPNEKFELRQFEQGIATAIHFLQEVAVKVPMKRQRIREAQRP
jgi:acetylornithine deacetylase/succinyl-diaminopimelate desuccinylase-like protein